MSAFAHSAIAQRYIDFLVRTNHAAIAREPELFASPTPEPDELFWQSRWFSGDFGRDFVTRDGQEVRIVQFGVWNHGVGPDFLECAVEIGTELKRGCIEIDRDVRDWDAHGHNENPGYDQVILHLFLTHRSAGTVFTRTAGNFAVPQVLLPSSQMEATENPPWPPAAKPGRCSFALRSLPEHEVAGILESAARYRLERKAGRLLRAAGIHGIDEALWQAMAEALGFSKNKLPMTVLAQRLSLRFLQSRSHDAEALLYGAAGFLNGSSFDDANADTRVYLRDLWEQWWRYRAQFAGGEPQRPIRWNLAGLRPVNHPQRRLAALWQLAVQWKAIRRFCEPASFSRVKLAKTMAALHHPYWDYHFTLSSRPSPRSMALLGASRIADIMANIIYPFVVRECGSFWAEYLKMPASLDNDKTRLAELRLFGGAERAEKFATKIWHQQALLQIYDDFCLVDASDCASCPFPEQMQGSSA